MTPWSVSATAGIPRSAALRTSRLTRPAPSRREYSVWLWRWTKLFGACGIGSKVVGGGPRGSRGYPRRAILKPLPPLSPGPAEMSHSGIREISNIAINRPGTIRLDVGQPNFRTPEHISEAGKRAIDDGFTFYTHTQGLIGLRERLVAKLQRVNGYAVTPEQIACASGGVGAIAAAMAAILEPGDEVLLPDPGWPNYRMMPPWLGARSVFYPLLAGADFLPDLEKLASLVSARTRILVIN